MKLYQAPLEGITNYIYRNALNKYYGGIDKFFTPFVVPHTKRKFSKQELRDLVPENNKGINLVPQILTNKAHEFMELAKEIREFGYDEINLNLGCPSGTVTAKYRGSGFLRDLYSLEKFLYEIFSDENAGKISIKTRLGYEEYEEWEELLKLYNKFPIYELTVHLRLRKDMYKNSVNKELWHYTRENCKLNTVYNGDLYSFEDIGELEEKAEACMLGRGLIEKPYLAKIYSENRLDYRYGSHEDISRLIDFNEEILRGYSEIIPDNKNILYKFKELWYYISNNFDNKDKLLKKIRKISKISELKDIFNELRNNY